MNKTVEDFEKILSDEEKILDEMISKQFELKTAVKDRNWEKLTKSIVDIDNLTNNFQEIEDCRVAVQDMLKVKEIHPYFEKLGELRSKLLKCKIENQAMRKYVNITRDFIKEVVDNALPQSGNKVYSKKGVIVQPQPQCVVLNQLF